MNSNYLNDHRPKPPKQPKPKAPRRYLHGNAAWLELCRLEEEWERTRATA